ncbi:MAG: ABC transporter ATP-binding protein [Nocardioidaceae bacterium]|nr:ABC transporter ATP-binding protein [Nocardioidaceae bacterium]
MAALAGRDELVESSSLLSLRGVSRSFVSSGETVSAVQDVSLAADAGEMVCVFGASGSGKTTLLNLIAGLDTADSGTVHIADVEVGSLTESERARHRLETVGVVFQEHQLIDEFTARENVALPLEVRGLPVGKAARQADIELERVGIRHLADRMPSQMSGGQRQRVGIARALAGQRRVLLADEPTGALDSTNSRALFALIRDLCRQGTLAVVCSHDAMCREFADTVYEMIDGQLLRREATVDALP